MNVASTPPAEVDGIPKVIWILWLQGIENAPPLVQQCVASWKKYNPGWNIILLDEQNMTQHADISPSVWRHATKLSRQALSNLLRINLLAQHGGVWADATCLCCRPLDEWLDDCTRSGFFAFAKPARDRLLSSWFFAVHKNCPLTQAYAAMVNDYFANSPRLHQWRLVRSLAKRLETIAMFSPRWSSWLIHPGVKIIFPVNPYHWFHYTFYRLLATNADCRKIWATTPQISADGPHEMQMKALQPVTPEIQAIIQRRRDPVYKLNWRIKDYPPGSVLDYLLRTV